MLFLGGEPPGGVRFRPPGPIHSARWMAKAIYSIKMCMFRKQLRLPAAEASGLLQVTVFIVKLYLKMWFTATHSVAAPRHDLQFLKDLVEYEKVNKKIALAAQTRFLYHLWYLSEESIGFSLFDEDLPDAERQLIATNVLCQDGEEGPARKRSLQIRDVPQMALSSLASRNTASFLTTLDVPCDFLQHPLCEWSVREDYKKGREIANNLRVVNDHAERAVKLMSDYNRGVTRKEQGFQDLLINVHSHRKSLPNVKKSTLIAKYDK